MIKKQAVVKSLQPFGTSIFTEMTALALKHKAINLSQGAPDYDGPLAIRERAAELLIEGPNQYVPSAGLMSLRKSVAQKMKRFYDLSIDPETEVTITYGATEGISATLLGILEPGDEVILLEPFYDSYPALASLAGATIRYVSLTGNEFSLPREELEKVFNQKTKAIIINNPQNPCGKVYTKDELEFIADLCEKHDAYVIGDEVYEHMVYDDHEHITLLSIPKLRNRSFVISSTAKTFSMTGWKIGMVVAAPELTKAVRMSHQFLTFCGNRPFQEAMAEAISYPDDYYDQLTKDYTHKRNLLCEGLTSVGFASLKPLGTYFVIVDISNLSFADDLEFCQTITKEAGVAAIPCSYFWQNRSGGRHLIRFCFCKQDDLLREAVSRLKQFLYHSQTL